MSRDRVPDLRVLTTKLVRLHGLSDAYGTALGLLPMHETGPM